MTQPGGAGYPPRGIRMRHLDRCGRVTGSHQPCIIPQVLVDSSTTPRPVQLVQVLIPLDYCPHGR